jgi:drug/metabolite transporter (DMT)-like permease
MTWALLALVAPIIWALGNHIDAWLMNTFLPSREEEEHGAGALIIVSCAVAVVIAPVIAIVAPQVFTVPNIDRMILVGVGIIEGLAILSYLYAVGEEDLGSVTAWFNSIPFLALILAFVMLGETITGIQGIAFVITLIGLVLVSIRTRETKLIFKSRIVTLMLLASIGYALMTVLFKYVTVADAFWISAFWQYVGLALLGLFFFAFIPAYRRSFLQVFKRKGPAFYGINFINEALFTGGTLISNFASLLAPVALVSLVSSMQPIIVILLGVTLGRIIPSMKEAVDLDPSDRIRAWIGIGLTVVGLVILLVWGM